MILASPLLFPSVRLCVWCARNTIKLYDYIVIIFEVLIHIFLDLLKYSVLTLVRYRTIEFLITAIIIVLIF